MSTGNNSEVVGLGREGEVTFILSPFSFLLLSTPPPPPLSILRHSPERLEQAWGHLFSTEVKTTTSRRKSDAVDLFARDQERAQKTVLWFDIANSTVDVCVTYWPRNVCLLT